MTKREKIQEAYGDVYELYSEFIDENGWLIKLSLIKSFDVKDLEIDGKKQRPLSLKGIENNNGWIKIESEDDLPTIGTYYTMTKFNSEISEKVFPHPRFSLEFNKEWWLKYVTHYQPIEKRQPPIY